MNEILSQTLSLPCGAVLPNRLAKAAMTEGLASPAGLPTEALLRLYAIWSDGGAGLLISGNIQVDGAHLERPGNVIVDRPADQAMSEALRDWAAAGTRNGNHFWAQINHAGRQTQKPVNPHPKAPSAIKVKLPGGQFGKPVPMTVEEIEQVVVRFGVCAAAVKEAGFTGVQVHAAHGYLLSQFLSPRSNHRQDYYGGSLENRARALLECVGSVRKAVGPDFPVAVKLNSADFQKGGFDFEESLQVAQWLEQSGIDLLEISGGTYEQPKLLGIAGMEAEDEQQMPASTALREAYFIDFARAMAERVAIPLMVTGGFRQRQAMEQAIAGGSADLIGLGRPLCVDTDAPLQLLAGASQLRRYENEVSLLPPWLHCLNRLGSIRAMGGFALQFWFYAQLEALGYEGAANPALSVLSATRERQRRDRRWLEARRR